MSSFLVWDRFTKEVFTCIPHAVGTRFELEPQVRHIDGWQDKFLSKDIPETLTTIMFKSSYIINANDEVVDIETLKTDEQKLADVKRVVKLDIKNMMDSLLVSDTASYTTTGLVNNITINARERDLSNVERVIVNMESSGAATTMFRCYNNTFVELSLEEVKVIRNELISYGFWLYQHKWEKEAEIDQATDEQSVLNITW